MAPFSTGSWKKIDSITGSVIDIKTSGFGNTMSAGLSTVYILTLSTSPAAPFSCTLYSVLAAPTTTAMFAPSNINVIAQTGVGIFANIVQFTGIQIIATGAPSGTPNAPESIEQLVLATNQGLFTSNAAQVTGGIRAATNQTAANWSVVANANNTTAQTAFFGIAGMDTPVRQTTWPIAISDAAGFKTFDRGSIDQFSGSGDATGATALFNSYFIPINFNANPLTAPFTTLDPIIYFFSDGGRRFFVFNATTTPPTVTQLGVIPYFTAEWRIGQPTVLSNPVLNTVQHFYWVKQIGATGILFAGTDAGVVGLE